MSGFVLQRFSEPYKNPCERRETSAARSDNEHQTRLYMNVDIAGA